MIGRPEWFTYRLAGWGLQPRTWQGWVYVAGLCAAFALVSMLPVPERIRDWGYYALAGLALLDVLDIMIRMGAHHDERERPALRPVDPGGPLRDGGDQARFDPLPALEALSVVPWTLQ